MVELKIGALHVWFRASILLSSCLTILLCVMLCNHMWHTETSLTIPVFSEMGFLMPWARTWCVYCSWKGFLHWKPPFEENFSQLILMGRASGATRRNLCSKTLQGGNPDCLAKAGVERESVERKKGWSLQSGFEPSKYSATSLLAKYYFSAPCQKMSWGSIFSCMSWVLSLFAEARLLDCFAMSMKWCVLVRTEVWLLSDKISELVHNNPI